MRRRHSLSAGRSFDGVPSGPGPDWDAFSAGPRGTLARPEPSDACGRVIQTSKLRFSELEIDIYGSRTARWLYTESLGKSHIGNPAGKERSHA